VRGICRQLHDIVVRAPIRAGDVVVSKISGLDSAIIATRDVLLAEEVATVDK